MEVHHHSHHGKKKWTDYFWEFLMLFLAVFCGFLAENLREHNIEKQREKKFARRLLSDIREDTVFYQKRLKDLEDAQKKQDSFIKIMEGPVRATDYEVTSAFMRLLNLYDVQVTTATYDQMKASGSLRYIHNDELTIGLQKYYEILLPRAVRRPESARDFFMQSVTPYVVKHFKMQNMEARGDSLVNRNQVIVNRTSESDQELITIMDIYNSFQQGLVAHLESAMKKGRELIEVIKREYHLK